jgi:hypothetical protein
MPLRLRGPQGDNWYLSALRSATMKSAAAADKEYEELVRVGAR